MEFKEKTPRSSWKSILSFLKNLISSIYFWVFYTKCVRKITDRPTKQFKAV